MAENFLCFGDPTPRLYPQLRAVPFSLSTSDLSFPPFTSSLKPCHNPGYPPLQSALTALFPVDVSIVGALEEAAGVLGLPGPPEYDVSMTKDQDWVETIKVRKGQGVCKCLRSKALPRIEKQLYFNSLETGRRGYCIPLLNISLVHRHYFESRAEKKKVYSTHANDSTTHRHRPRAKNAAIRFANRT